MRSIALALVLLAHSLAYAETVQVKYYGPVPLDAFACKDVNEKSDFARIFCDAAERYMVIRLTATHSHHCKSTPQW